MKKFYVVLVFCVIAQLESFAFGLNSGPGLPKSGPGLSDKHLSIDQGSTLITYALSVGAYQLHEIRVEHFFRDRWSLLYSMGYSNGQSPTFSSDVEGTNEFRPPIGATLGVSVFSMSCCAYTCGGGGYASDLFGFFTLACMIPDGIAYHIPVADRFSVSPYVNFSGLSYQWNNRQGSSSIVYSPMTGCRVIMPLSKDFVFMAEQNFRRAAGGNIITSTGASLSVSF